MSEDPRSVNAPPIDNTSPHMANGEADNAQDKPELTPQGRPKGRRRKPPPQVDGVEWFSKIPDDHVKWLWPGAIPEGVIVLIEGKKGKGKSTMLAAIIACATGGPELPGWTGPRDMRVLVVCSEDDYRKVVKPRLRAAGAVLDRVGRLNVKNSDGTSRKVVLPEDTKLVKETMQAAGATMIVLDPHISLKSPTLDIRHEDKAKEYLDPLAAMLAEINATALLSRNLKKGKVIDPLDAGYGSGGVGNTARSILRCDKHPHERGRFLLSVVECNYGQPMPTKVYSFAPTKHKVPRIEWHGDSPMSVDAIAEGRGDQGEQGEWRDADVLLYRVIGNEWTRHATIAAAADAGGITPKMLRRAKEGLHVPSRFEASGEPPYWQWGPPPDGWPPGLVALANEEGGYKNKRGHLGHLAKMRAKKPQ
jgi:hypothetical protein